MGIKRTSSEGAVKKAAKESAKPATPAAKQPAKRKVVALAKVEEPPQKPKKTAARKSAPTSRTKAESSPAPAVAKRVPTTEEIALRAYFLSEKRQTEGLPGSSEGDWLEAERQLLAE